MNKRGVGRFVLLVGSLAVALIAAELALRAHYELSWRGSIADLRTEAKAPTGGRQVTLGQMLRPSPNPRLVYELKPGLDVRFEQADVRTSAAGYREAAHPTVKPVGVLRVLGIGDSTMFGWGVAEDERYLDRLEARLAAERPGPTWQTIVTAVPGYNLVMEIESLFERGLGYEPDLIVYGWNPNDICLPNFLLPKKEVWRLDSFVVEYAGGLASRAVGLRPRERATDARCYDDDLPERHRALGGREPFREALDRLARLGRETSIPIVVVADYEADFVGYTAMELPPPLLYVEPPRTPRDGLVLSRRDPHPNARGHDLVADSLYESLARAGIWSELEMNLTARQGNETS